MKNIKKYKDRFFSLLESEMGNVKPLIVEAEFDVYEKNVINSQIGGLGFEKVSEKDENGMTTLQYDMELSGIETVSSGQEKSDPPKLSVLLMSEPTDQDLNQRELAIKIFLNGENITQKISGGSAPYVTMPWNEFKHEGYDLIKKSIDFAKSQKKDEVNSDYTPTIKDIIKKYGFTEIKQDDGTMLFVKEVGNRKSFLIKISEQGSMVKIQPFVFDHEAHKNPIFYGEELPVTVGTINIERGQKDNPKVLSLDIDKEDISGSESKITQAIETGMRLAKEYISKFDAMKKLEDDSDFKLR